MTALPKPPSLRKASGMIGSKATAPRRMMSARALKGMLPSSRCLALVTLLWKASQVRVCGTVLPLNSAWPSPRIWRPLVGIFSSLPRGDEAWLPRQTWTMGLPCSSFLRSSHLVRTPPWCHEV
ncbi:hypothetical protein D3C72_1902200 [compost metagenome]